MKAVKLLKPYKQYNEGEVAGFGESINRQLVEAGVAEEYVERKGKDSAKKSAPGDSGGQAGTDGGQAGDGKTPPEGE